ncbi:LytR/AlgR family response regulator transcription factor [Chitinophaga sancti]|uniref:LytTR family DNA-binding domain-containing protein n=1 Tax=Chitinophaga sancti TaxID=1004 RepID=A0A1K1QHI5_9BACT|nr:LytTR family DNA-binding domain-containing protein [Chitinophaga sancti]WQD65266.1 LytTR family DNA-binding domain-containing protein [Chitinophaga sancti]WQG89110.1 LytTR family DNA-binding domain-containing protein [Chitinophaga sancti]SFW59394.1 two component transcriptional regulator, LytTR family [Chitinophaga sancti]
MSEIKAIIVDDEQHCIDALQTMLAKKCPEVTVLGGVNSVKAAKELIDEVHPDVVFLDVEMPHQNGFELLKLFDKINFDIIFTTAYEQYALKAIKFNALDYLLKPFSVKELQDAVQKCVSRKNVQQAEPGNSPLDVFLQNMKTLHQTHKKIALPTINGLVFMPVQNIVRCESTGNYTRIFFTDKKNLMVSRPLKEFEELLTDVDFFRVHNSHLINLQQMQSYIQGEGGFALMSDGTQVEVSRRRKADFLKKAMQF